MTQTEQTSFGYQVQLPEFEGPLDLLLHLVKRHELDIIDIPIAFVTQKYLEYLELMRSLNLDIAGEYLLMAATLAHIKSRELLPKQPSDEEEDEEEQGISKEELIRRLLEYQRYKDAAEQLGERPALGRQVFTRGAPTEKVDQSEAPLKEVGTFALIEALARVAERAKLDMSYDVLVERMSISDKINAWVDLFAERETLSFDEMVPNGASTQQFRHELVVTLLSILEMAKLRMIRILQETGTGEIFVTRRGELRPIENMTETYA